MKRKMTTSVCAALLAGVPAFLGAVDLVRDGRPVSAIKISEKASPVERHAADEFRIYLKKITGADVPVGTDVKAEAVVRFVLGKPEGVKLDGFAIEAGSGEMRICAAEERGFLFGVYSTLKRCGDVCWLYPGEEGEVCPKRATFTVPDGRVVRNPILAQRRFIFNGGSGFVPDSYDWVLRNGIQLHMYPVPAGSKAEAFGIARACIWIGGGGFQEFLDYGKRDKRPYFEKHPEQFGLMRGKRILSNNDVYCQPCTSNPETLAELLKGNLASIDESRHGDERPIQWNLANDDYLNWCECANCAKLDVPEEMEYNRHGSRWWEYVNFMANGILSARRNVTLTCFAYQTYRWPSARVKPDPRVAPVICPHGRCYTHSLDDPTCPVNARRFRPMFERWFEAGAHPTTFEYHPELPGKSHYVFTARSWVKDLVWYAKKGMGGFGMVVTAPTGVYEHHDYGRKHLYGLTNQWRSNWLRHWATGHFTWNPEDDFDAVYEKVGALYYGRTWPVMKEYRALLENAIYDSRVHFAYGVPDAELGICAERPGLVDTARRLLKEGAGLAAGDPVLSSRLAKESDWFERNWIACLDLYLRNKTTGYNARKIVRPIVIDGKLDEPDWKEAKFDSDFKSYVEGGSPAPANPQTFVKVAYDRDNLYFGIEAMKPADGSTLDTAKKDGLGALHGSHFEIYVTPPSLNGRYYHIGLSHNGHLYQALTTSDSERDTNVRVNPEWKIADASDRWTVEMRMPLGALGLHVVDGDVWKVNVARVASDGRGRKTEAVSSWCNSVFHGSTAHRNLAFGEKGAVLENGDFEDVAKPLVEKKNQRWTYVGDRAPAKWTFNNITEAKANVVTGKAPSGRNYLHVESPGYAYFGQFLKKGSLCPGFVTIVWRARGQGEISANVYIAGTYHSDKAFNGKLSSPADWRPYTTTFPLAAEDLAKGSATFYFRTSGSVDIDDVRIVSEKPEEMPEDAKHR